jgi:hypothetical protein
VSRRREDFDAALDEAEHLLLLVLDGVVLPSGPCEYPDCKAQGAQHRHGVWCRKHERKMERVRRDG